MQDNLGTGGITTNTESHERINGDEYLDPITGVLTFNNSFGSGNAVGAEDSSTPFINDVYSRNEMIDAYNIDDLGINENYEKMFNDYNGCNKHSSQGTTTTDRLSFSDKYHPKIHSSLGTVPSSGSSSLSPSPCSAVVMNMTTF